MPEYVPAVVREAEAEIGRAMPTLPKAVVVSGLEHVGLPAQRALLQVLTERKLVIDEEKAGFNGNPFEGGTWNLPDDFLMVYICKSDSRERPALLRGLIDKFSMSVDVMITPSTRQAYAAYRGTLGGTPHTSPFPSSQALPHSHSDAPTPISPLRSPSFRPSILPTPTTIPTPTTSAPPPIPPSELDALRALASPSPPPDAHAHTAAHPALTTYLRDLFSAARHHPALDGTLLTRRAHADAEALARAYRVLAGDSLGAELVAESARALHGAAEKGAETRSVGGAASVRSEWSKDVDATDWALVDEDEEELDRGGRGFGGGGRAGDPGRAAEPLEGLGALDEVRSLDVGSPGQMMLAPEVWDVSEVDIARVFPRVVSHRLRVRDGPADEILGSLMWPAAGAEDAGKWERKTVKEVLIEILADV
ncbi:hypothetical protein WOLCODRAFT_91845 [Wolfiporia cocos MD-104 SS10]|uniref:Uncharacterized protein n=1 Tax=Wolfiporia cocos (strain MD-104) TaxID=742152 RepID=A0A2H3JJC6_WOLCO|nr:hypothetical protein WOLCODRAFT_91845 [Wolfiporia cocos MD-104 SS10]